MDWSYDNARLTECDLDTVFQYGPRDSTVVEMLGEKDYEPVISTLRSDNNEECDEWRKWLKQFEKKTARSRGAGSGLVVILARRVGEATTATMQEVSVSAWKKSLENPTPASVEVQTDPYSGLSEKTMSALRSLAKSKDIILPTKTHTRKEVRTLPFARETFKAISEAFQTHGSIAKAISRSDVPMCSFDKVEMGETAYVYNCRTSDAWEHDLALSATYFPKRQLTLAIVYGCTIFQEQKVIKRLDLVRQEVLHPLLMSGIIAELERKRHGKEVDKMSINLEGKIQQFQVTTDDLKGRVNLEEKTQRNREKRSTWLDTVYLRNNLLTWKTQLQKMANHAHKLNESKQQSEGLRVDSGLTAVPEGDAPGKLDEEMENPQFQWYQDSIKTFKETKAQQDESDHAFTAAGKKIEERLSIIQEEYTDWVRDCSMRVDGMAMATQWASGETNTEIALSTRRDSKYMRSIAVLTMVFLPGTWLAGVFSMTFFDWNTEGGEVFVSFYLWIYFAVTVILTSLTVGLWYYLTVYWPKHFTKSIEESDKYV